MTSKALVVKHPPPQVAPQALAPHVSNNSCLGEEPLQAMRRGLEMRGKGPDETPSLAGRIF